MPPRTKDKICWINLNVFVYCTVKLSIISAKNTHRFVYILTHFLPSRPLCFKMKPWDISQSRVCPMIEKGWWERWTQFLVLSFSSPCVTPRPPTIMRPEPLWPGQGNFIEARPPSLFAIQTQFCDNLVTIMLQLSSVSDDLRDPLASKQTNKKFLSFHEDLFDIHIIKPTESSRWRNKADNLEMISQMLHLLTSNPHFFTWIPRDPLGAQMLSWIVGAPASFRPCKCAQLYFGNTTT